MEIEAPILGSLAALMPKEGNTINIPAAPNTGGGDLTPAEKLAAAEALIQAEKDKAKAAGGANPDEEGVVEPTAEEIQTKLDELSAKEETELTDEDKAYITKYTAAQVDEITAVKQDIENTYGIKLEGTYENGPEGLKKIAQEVAPALAEQMFLQGLDNIPHMKEFYLHMTEGRSIETFLTKNSKPSFESIELKDATDVTDEALKTKLINNHKQLIELDLKSKGLSEGDIKTFIELYEVRNGLYEKAKESRDSLKARHTAKVDADIKAENDKIAASVEEQKATVKKVEAMITANDFGGFQIPGADLQAFKDALFKPVDKDGNSLLDYKRAKLTMEQRLILDYIVLKDLKNIGLTKKDASKVFSFKKASEENKSRDLKLNGAGGAGNNGNASFDIKTIDFSKLVVSK